MESNKIQYQAYGIIHTANYADIPNPHSDARRLQYIDYQTGLPPSERRGTDGKLLIENTQYDKPTSKTSIPKAESYLEAADYSFLTRFGADVLLHPYNDLNFGNGIIYSPDMLATVHHGGKKIQYYVESHCSHQEDGQPLQSDIKDKTLALANWADSRVLVFKQNVYFQIVAFNPLYGYPTVYDGSDSALCYCPHCHALIPEVRQPGGGMFPMTCRFCGATDYKVAFRGDLGGIDNAVCGCLTLDGNWKLNQTEFFCIASECNVTVPVKGELIPHIRFRDTYGTKCQILEKPFLNRFESA